MDSIFWLFMAAAVMVCAMLVTWLLRKKSATKTFTGNVDGSTAFETQASDHHANTASGNMEEAVRALLDGGNKIEAIKRVRGQTGLGLKEAKDLVEAMERGESVSMHAGAPPAEFHGDLDNEARRLVAAGKAIEAIKLVRQQKNLGLKEAKDYVDRL